jgi:hypothetical protein
MEELGLSLPYAMATNNNPEKNSRYQQYLNTSLDAVKANSPTPETKAKDVTKQVMQSATPAAPNEAKRRIETAHQAYQTSLKNKPLADMNPQEKYMLELGRQAEKYTARRLSLQDNTVLSKIDKETGKNLIKNHGVTENGLAQILEKHSPAAAKHPQGTKDYAVNMAKICDREAQTPHERPSKEEELRQQQMMQEMQLYKNRER